MAKNKIPLAHFKAALFYLEQIEQFNEALLYATPGFNLSRHSIKTRIQMVNKIIAKMEEKTLKLKMKAEEGILHEKETKETGLHPPCET